MTLFRARIVRRVLTNPLLGDTTEWPSGTVIDLLLKNGADVNAPPAKHNGRTALQAAAGRKDIKRTQLFQGIGGLGTLPNGQDENLRIIKLLLDQGADVNAPPAEYEGRTALQAAAGREKEDEVQSLEIINLLRDEGADVHAPAGEHGGQTALQAASGKDSVDIVRALISQPTPPHTSLQFPITINGNCLTQKTEIVTSETVYIGQLKHALVQTKGPLTTAQSSELASLNLEKQNYVSDNTHIYSYQGANLAAVRRLDYVAYADDYQQLFKIEPRLKPTTFPSFSHTGTSIKIDIVFHDDIDPKSEEIGKVVAEKACVSVGHIQTGNHKVRLVTQRRCLPAIATIDAVRLIQDVPEVVLYSGEARELFNARDVVEFGQTERGEGVGTYRGLFD
ncbi:hypothetical protein O1611_g3491 [Lasiodiplodia mahajangana]|uniref:Uncharacterized protein n=1 Tax=Lasiodiplodia mahajangana TaxID=1108764 RepID=A0ACC2JRU8_9PEZI|nr:hypothetical protein O1611_g3491 [Lasiodiplodia mahajangana]